MDTASTGTHKHGWCSYSTSAAATINHCKSAARSRSFEPVESRSDLHTGAGPSKEETQHGRIGPSS
eukprot:5748849-Karenia_brevis.AAC.1